MSRNAARLVGRRTECDRLSGLVAAAKAGRSQVVVLRGDAGIGKTALLEFVLERATGCRVGRAAGVESEMELAFAGLHQLCRPFLDRLVDLPPPQEEALGAAFGLRPGTAPDRFLVGLAVLSLLSAVAEERPLVCLVDDVQWLDRSSARTLEFVARRLRDEPVAMVFAVRDPEEEPVLVGLPELVLRGLTRTDAATLLHSVVTGRLDPRVRDRILAETHGNPLAILELSRARSTTEWAFGGVTAVAGPLADRLEQGFERRAGQLPEDGRRLLLIAAAEPIGDVSLLWRAAGWLGIGPAAATAAEDSELIELRDRVEFRHPLVRSAVYRSATPAERRAVHRALAEATDAEEDPDRRAWHLAHAAAGPDEPTAGELERSAGRALAHGGLSAAAAFLEKAAQLTPDPAGRARRCLEAAQAKMSAGAVDDASALVATAEQGPLDEPERARADLLRARISLVATAGTEALPLLLGAAARAERRDERLARDAYLDAFSAALFAGRLASGPGPRQVAEAVRRHRPPAGAGSADVLLEGLGLLFTDGYGAAAPVLQRAVRTLATEEPGLDEALGVGWLAAAAAASLWDDVTWEALSRRLVELAREAGAVGVLPVALDVRALAHLFTGDLPAGTSLVEEARSVSEMTGSALTPYGEVGLLAVRGNAERAELLFRQYQDDAVARGEGIGISTVQWARAVLANGLGRYEEAVRAAHDAAASPELGPSRWALAELVEAGVRTGDTATAAAAFEELSAMTRATGTEWALGLEAGRRALLCRRSAADLLYREAIDRLSRTTVRVELARTRLLYGEWLRREGRRVDARAQLREAHEALRAMDVEGFAERARHELEATGETVRKRSVTTVPTLTGQEARIARLAAQGRTNQEIGAELYISHRTVEWHLRKIFDKLGVTTRRELRRSVLELPEP